MHKLILSILFFSMVYTFPVYTQNNVDFEGIIRVVKSNKTDTVTLIFMIKDNKVRIDELNKQGQTKKSTIVNIGTPEIYYLKPDKKLYTKITSYRLKESLDTSRILLKTGNYKNILGKKCYQWRLKIPDINTEICYWVSSESYPQFYAILSLIDVNLTEKYFLEIKDSKNVFPMLIVERSLLREWKSQIEVTEIKPMQLDNHIFEIPKNYTFFEK
jgi:hypothetical protein